MHAAAVLGTTRARITIPLYLVCVSVQACVCLFFKRSLQGKISMHLRGLYFISGTEGDKMAPFLVGIHNRGNDVLATKTWEKKVSLWLCLCTHTEEEGTKPSICSLRTNTIEHKAEHLIKIFSFTSSAKEAGLLENYDGYSVRPKHISGNLSRHIWFHLQICI